MKKPYRDFDLPTRHLADVPQYIPPKARSSREIDRRHDMPHGSVLAEQQLLGVIIVRRVIDKISDKPDVDYAAETFAPAGQATAWNLYARYAETMRRRGKLPVFMKEWYDAAPDAAELLDQSRNKLVDLEDLADQYFTSVLNRSPKLAKQATALGRMTCETALLLSCLPIGDALPGTSQFVAQDMARQAGLKGLHAARHSAAELGTAPTFAQLADPDSDLAVHIRRTAPNGVYEAFDEAISSFAMTR